MTTFLFTLVLFIAIVAAMAVGVVVSGRRLHGSCGGVGAGDCSCSKARQEKCKRGEGALHSDQPIAPQRLARAERSSS